MTKVSETDLAWLAGVIDGEGTVVLGVRRQTSGRRTPQLTIAIYNNDQNVVSGIRRVLEHANIRYSDQVHDHRGYRPNHAIVVPMTAALQLLPLVRPYLVRQIARLEVAADLLAPRYATTGRTRARQIGPRLRVHWSDEDLAAWEVIRHRFTNNDRALRSGRNAKRLADG